MPHHFRRRSVVRKEDVQNFGLEELDSNLLKSALIHRYVLHVPKLVLAHCVGVESKRPNATDQIILNATSNSFV